MERNECTFRLRPACPEAFDTGKADDEHAALYLFPVLGTRASRAVSWAALRFSPTAQPWRSLGLRRGLQSRRRASKR
jgi:hypothetical protein